MTIRLSAFPAPRIVLPVLAAIGLAAAVLGAPTADSARRASDAIAASAVVGFDHGLPVLLIAPIEVTARRRDASHAAASGEQRAAAPADGALCTPDAS